MFILKGTRNKQKKKKITFEEIPTTFLNVLKLLSFFLHKLCFFTKMCG